MERFQKLNSNWKIIWTKEVEKYYKKYPDPERFKRIIEILKTNPYEGANIKRLVGELLGLYRYRFSNLRLIYKIDETKKQIILVYFGTRGDIY